MTPDPNTPVPISDEQLAVWIKALGRGEQHSSLPLLTELRALRARVATYEKALIQISLDSKEKGEDLEDASSGNNFDDTYYEGTKRGSFYAGEIARAALSALGIPSPAAGEGGKG